MNARRPSPDEPRGGSSGGRVLLIGAVVFALTATGALVLTDEQKWLRLGIIAALWAALAGAFLAAKYRRQLTDQEEVAADRQERYELELEREVAARREYELEVEAEAKRHAEENSRDDIAALRDELSTLRHTLESLLGGEFLVERYALRAESTRMRSVREDRSLAMRNNLKRLPAAQPKDDDVVPTVVREAETDLIERVREAHHVPRREPPVPHPPQRAEPRPESRPASHPPQRAEQKPGSRPGSRSAQRAEPMVESGSWPVQRVEPMAESRSASWPAQRVEPVQESGSWPARRVEPVAESGSWSAQRAEPVAESSWPAQRVGPAAESGSWPVQRAEPVAESGSWPAQRAEPVAESGSWPAQRVEPATESSWPARRAEPVAESGSRPVQRVESPQESRPSLPRRAERPARTEWPTPEPVSRTEPVQPSRQERREHTPHPAEVSDRWFIPGALEADEWAPSWESSRHTGAQPEQSSWLARYNNPEPAVPEEPSYHSRAYVEQHRAEPEAPASGRRHARSEPAEPAESGGGRRRRAEGQPSWQETVALRKDGGRNGSHARPEAAEDRSGGSHAAGRSVNELLASHGVEASPRRRRRRED